MTHSENRWCACLCAFACACVERVRNHQCVQARRQWHGEPAEHGHVDSTNDSGASSGAVRPSASGATPCTWYRSMEAGTHEAAANAVDEEARKVRPNEAQGSWQSKPVPHKRWVVGMHTAKAHLSVVAPLEVTARKVAGSPLEKQCLRLTTGRRRLVAAPGVSALEVLLKPNDAIQRSTVQPAPPVARATPVFTEDVSDPEEAGIADTEAVVVGHFGVWRARYFLWGSLGAHAPTAALHGLPRVFEGAVGARGTLCALLQGQCSAFVLLWLRIDHITLGTRAFFARFPLKICVFAAAGAAPEPAFVASAPAAAYLLGLIVPRAWADPCWCTAVTPSVEVRLEFCAL